MEYAVPRADDLPSFQIDHTVTPSPHNPLGVKGIGEAGTIASTAARYAILAGVDSPMMTEAKALMQDYSEHVFTWENATEMNELMGRLGQATGKPGLPVPPPI